jgi:hypothetical protein
MIGAEQALQAQISKKPVDRICRNPTRNFRLSHKEEIRTPAIIERFDPSKEKHAARRLGWSSPSLVTTEAADADWIEMNIPVKAQGRSVCTL